MLSLVLALSLQIAPQMPATTTVGRRGPEYPYRKPVSPTSRVAYWTRMQSRCEERGKRSCPIVAPDLVMVEADKPSDRDSDVGRRRPLRRVR